MRMETGNQATVSQRHWGLAAMGQLIPQWGQEVSQRHPPDKVNSLRSWSQGAAVVEAPEAPGWTGASLPLRLGEAQESILDQPN